MRLFSARLCLVLLIPLQAAYIASAADDAVKVQVVKYSGLGDVIKHNKDKVVVVDFWADTCLPCKKEFPRLVKMHKNYSPDSFAAISVSLDDPQDSKAMGRVLAFLRKQQATFTNVVLDEKAEFWQDKLKFDGPPCVFVFDREGKWKQFAPPVEYTDVEKYVAELMKGK
jgi:thiol-disulfide isomerase/thioredoxin